MKIKTFQVNKNNLIEINPEALQDLLDEAYKEGYEDGKNSIPVYYPVTYPYAPITYKEPYVTWSTSTTRGEIK